jgi:protein-S-isoprenylcysteine O-methyltransferase Ste14
VVVPLIFRPGAGELAYNVALAAWLVFEFVMRVRQRLRARSIATLGRFFQYWIKVQPGHRVVTNGPYRYVRHPSYTGIALVLIGIALACDDVWSLLAVAVLGGVGLAVRIRAEERQLTEALGAEYQQFATSRKRLVPGVW